MVLQIPQGTHLNLEYLMGSQYSVRMSQNLGDGKIQGNGKESLSDMKVHRNYKQVVYSLGKMEKGEKSVEYKKW